MKLRPTLTSAVLSLALAAGAMPASIVFSAPAQAAKAKQQQLSSPKLGILVKKMQELLDKNKNQEALAKAMEASKLPDLRPFDQAVVNDFLGRIYFNLQDYPNAVAAFDAEYATSAMPEENKES